MPRKKVTVVGAGNVGASLAQAEKLVALADERELTLMLDHTFCYTAAVACIRDTIASSVSFVPGLSRRHAWIRRSRSGVSFSRAAGPVVLTAGIGGPEGSFSRPGAACSSQTIPVCAISRAASHRAAAACPS